MYTISFGRWSSSHGTYLTQKRVYLQGWRWTPVVRVALRYGWSPGSYRRGWEAAIRDHCIQVNTDPPDRARGKGASDLGPARQGKREQTL